MTKSDIYVDCRMIDHSGIGTYLKNVLPFLIRIFPQRLILLGNPLRLAALYGDIVRTLPFTAHIYSFSANIFFLKHIPSGSTLWVPHFNAPLLLRSKVRLVTTIHDCFHLDFPDSFPFYERIYAKLLYGNAVRKSFRLLTVSKFSQSRLEHFFGSKASSKIITIPNGVNQKLYREKSTPPSGLKPGFILLVGAIKPHKNISFAIQIFLKLRRNNSKLELCIVGNRDGLIHADNSINSQLYREGIKFLGKLESTQLVWCYQNCALFLLPSLYEGFGLPILEAMAAGAKIATSNAASIPEVGGDLVTYFDPNDLENAVEKVQKALSRPATATGHFSTQSWLNRFSWETTANRIAEALE